MQSLDGNFAGSTLIRLRDGDPPPATLALAAGLALIEAVDAAAPGRTTQLKWPNDLMLDHAKLGGILLERAGDRVVAGFGVNLAAAPKIESRATVSLGGVTPQAFAPLLAASLARLLVAWRTAPPAAFVDAWQLRAHPIGTPITVHSGPGELLSGTFDGLAPIGASCCAFPTVDRAHPCWRRGARQARRGALGREYAARDRCRKYQYRLLAGR